MSPYLSYVKAFGTDLRKIAVWEPGTRVELGDYGEVQEQQWKRLGSIWDLIPGVGERLREFTTSRLAGLSLGSAHIVSGNAGATYDGIPGGLGLTIKFSSDHSVFVRAENCETHSLAHLQDVADELAARAILRRGWTIVNEVRSAKRFLVLIGVGSGGELRVTAKTSDILDAFVAGRLSTDNKVQISGTEVLQYLGRSGPIHMSLMKVSGPGVFRRRAKAERVEFAEGSRTPTGERTKPKGEPVYVEAVDAKEFCEMLT